MRSGNGDPPTRSKRGAGPPPFITRFGDCSDLELWLDAPADAHELRALLERAHERAHAVPRHSPRLHVRKVSKRFERKALRTPILGRQGTPVGLRAARRARGTVAAVTSPTDGQGRGGTGAQAGGAVAVPSPTTAKVEGLGAQLSANMGDRHAAAHRRQASPPRHRRAANSPDFDVVYEPELTKESLEQRLKALEFSSCARRRSRQRRSTTPSS